MKLTERQLRNTVKRLVKEQIAPPGYSDEPPINSRDDFLDDVMNDYHDGGRDNVNHQTLVMAPRFYGTGVTGALKLVGEFSRAFGADGDLDDILYMANVAYGGQPLDV